MSISVKDQLKKNSMLKKTVKKIKVKREYLKDVKHTNKHLTENEETQEQLEYRLLLLIHSIEKGMCHFSPRPFGFEKIRSLLKYLKLYEDKEYSKNTSAYNMGVSIIKKWSDYFIENSWENNAEYIMLYSEFFKKYKKNKFIDKVGYKDIDIEKLDVSRQGNFESLMKSRFSARNYANKPLSKKDIINVVELAEYSPSACNRQMIKVHFFSNRKNVDYLSKVLHGTGGLNLSTVNYFVITFDSNSLDFYGERNQGYLNAGLFAMNLSNAMHFKGIGSCFLQVANTVAEENAMKAELGIKEYERIAVCIGCGYYEKKNRVPSSGRKKTQEILSLDAD